jgi:predicted AAA+ superfamily ATPase
MNKIVTRYLEPQVKLDLSNKMVFIGGPRQVGKTTFSLGMLDDPSVKHPAYLNWDDTSARNKILERKLPSGEPLIIFDEIHKFAKWRNLVKGLYDTQKGHRKFLVTGSARLDYYRKGGDSLQGRYHFHRLHPFTLPELVSIGSKSQIEQLLTFGGFPEPLLKGDSRTWRRWQLERRKRVVYDDLRDLEQVREISLIDLLANELPNRVGSPLSIANLKNLLESAHQSVARWLDILERLYYCFRLPPFGGSRIRAVKKESKLYLWDWSLVKDKGARFENFVASHLLKYCHFIEDTLGYEMDLRYIRDTDKREVDFVVLKDKVPQFAVECKTGEKALSPAISYFKERTKIQEFYQVHLGTADYETNGARVLPFEKLCTELNLV